jgi:hypothetical protein
VPIVFGFGGKWLDLLKEIAPHLTRVAVFRDDTNPAGRIGRSAPTKDRGFHKEDRRIARP